MAAFEVEQCVDVDAPVILFEDVLSAGASEPSAFVPQQ